MSVWLHGPCKCHEFYGNSFSLKLTLVREKEEAESLLQSHFQRVALGRGNNALAWIFCRRFLEEWHTDDECENIVDLFCVRAVLFTNPLVCG